MPCHHDAASIDRSWFGETRSKRYDLRRLVWSLEILFGIVEMTQIGRQSLGKLHAFFLTRVIFSCFVMGVVVQVL